MLRIEVDGIEKLELKAPELPLGQIADFIVLDNTQNLEQARSFDGSAIAPLKPATIARKGHARVFFDKGKLFKSVFKTRISVNEYDVLLRPIRANIGLYLQEKGRRWFGFSTRIKPQIDKLLSNLKIRIG